jgi:hypothetical protein
MPEITPLFKSFEDFKKTHNAINTAGKILGGIRIATNPTPLGIAGLLANEVTERLTDKSIPEHILKYLRENIKPATGSGNVGPDKSGTVIAEGGYFRDPTQRHATAMRAGQYADGGQVEQELDFLEALERQRLRDEAFDNEFAIEVAAQSNYAADIDPSIARYHGFKGVPGTEKLNMKGFYINPEKTNLPVGTFDEPITGYTSRGFSSVPTEVGTINAIHDAATPFVYAHEYRHKQFPDLNETQLRIVDGMTALNEEQWSQAVEMFRQQYYENSGVEMTPSKAQERLIDILEDKRIRRHYDDLANLVFGAEWDRDARSTKEGPQDSREDYIESRLNTAFFVKKAKELKELEKYNRDLPEQNQERLEERQEREARAAVKNYATGGLASLSPVARNMFQGYDIRRGVGAYAPYTRRA